MDGHFLIQLAVFQGVATFAGPIARMLKLGSILGYLLAGAFIGPYGAAKTGKTAPFARKATFARLASRISPPAVNAFARA